MLKNPEKFFKDISFTLRRNYKVVFLNIASLAGIVLLGINIYRVLSIGAQRYKLIATEELGLKQVKQEELQLENNLREYSSLDFIESQSRDFLSLARDGDLILVIPRIDEEKKESAIENFDSGMKSEPSINLWIELLF